MCEAAGLISGAAKPTNIRSNQMVLHLKAKQNKTNERGLPNQGPWSTPDEQANSISAFSFIA